MPAPLVHVVPFHPIVVQRPREDWHRLGIDIGGGKIISVKGKAAFSLFQQIRGKNVHAHGRGFPFPEMSGCFARHAVYTPHNDTVGSRWWTAAIRRLIFNRYDKIICLTDYGKRCFMKAGIRPEKLVVIPNPVDYRFFSRPAGGKAFRKAFGLGKQPFALAVGLRPLKNPNVIIQACESAGVTCVLAGPQTTAEVQKSWGASGFEWYRPPRLHQSSHLVLTGQLTATEFLGALDAATVFANSSDYECFGLAVYEAAAAGLPLCLPEYGAFEVFRKAALFHPAKDYKALASNISTYLDNPALRLTHGKEARRIAKGCNYPIVRQQMEMLYKEVGFL